MILPVIMAGGSGTRLWPLSRKKNPKQFLNITDDLSMLQVTVNRLTNLDVSNPIVICNEDHRFIAAEQLRMNGLVSADIILEPMGKNTAPAIALAALHAKKSGKDPVLLVLAADHVMHDVSAFEAVVEGGRLKAEEGRLVTFGIVPTHAETGYGYIKQGKTQGAVGFDVAAFVEKPDLATAEEYFEGKEHLWNSGMFMFKASVYLDELTKFRPDILSACEHAISVETNDLDFIRINESEFAKCPEESIDYAIMEKTELATVLPLDCGWNDVGGFSALWDVLEKDAYGNATKGETLMVDTQDSLVITDKKLVTTLGVKALVIVNTKDAILVADKAKSQEVKKIVTQLQRDDRLEVEFHREVFRPWGSYDSIDNGTRYQVKRITVQPGAKLSVQMHHHRAEHWIVVSGTAKVLNGDKEVLLTENQSTYIPVGVVHALENPGKVPLELIEVQSGSYLGEDDIVRFEDKYGRV